MDEIQITDLSSRVLNAMRARNLKAKPITEFERYGLRRILLHFSEHEWIAYSKEAVWAFVLQERLRVYPCHGRHEKRSRTENQRLHGKRRITTRNEQKRARRPPEMLRQAADFIFWRFPLRIPVWVRFGSNGKATKFSIGKSSENAEKSG